MHKVIYGFLCAFYMLNGSAESVVNVKDNTDVPITFSTGNYNRLVVRGDKIVEAVFPEKSMGIRRDEQDGSIWPSAPELAP